MNTWILEAEGGRYEALPYPAGHGYQLLLELSDAAGGAFDLLTDLEGEKGLGELLSSIARALLQMGGEAFLDRVFRGVKFISDKRKVYSLDNPTDRDELFRGRLGELMRVLAWVLRENFAPFWTEGLPELLKSFGLVPVEAEGEAQNNSTNP